MNTKFLMVAAILASLPVSIVAVGGDVKPDDELKAIGIDRKRFLK